MSDETIGADGLSVTKRAILELRELRSKVAKHTEPVAIVGIGCRFPAADGPEAMWQLLQSGQDAITVVPQDRWDIDQFYDPDPATPGKMYSRWGGFLKGIDQFDAAFFDLAAEEARTMDPQHRLMLEVAWEALEDAGQAKQASAEVGVFVGTMIADYDRLRSDDLRDINTFLSTNGTNCALAGRLSYSLGLRGPCLTVETACSSGLVAVHLACQALRDDECSLALAGAVHLILHPVATIAVSRTGALSSDGRCKSFDAKAPGYVRGEGCGVVVLKRLSDALAAGDRIFAVIRGSAVNHNGASTSFAAPSGIAQKAVLRRALASGGIEPSQVGFVEAHGTGTALGDPVEVQALEMIYTSGRGPDRRLGLGSVKTNIGHLEPVAGIAGLIKGTLALFHEEIPPQVHLRALNSHISLETTSIVIPGGRTAWPGGLGRRLIGVTSLGLTGTNAHVIVEEPPPHVAVSADLAGPVWPTQLLGISARSDAALKELCRRYISHLRTPRGVLWSDTVHTANVRRLHFEKRLAVIAKDAEQAAHSLEAWLRGEQVDSLLTGERAGEPPDVTFFFSGGSQLDPGTGQKLYLLSPVFRAALERCAEVLDREFDEPFLKVLFGNREGLPCRTAYGQAAAFSIAYALAEVWKSCGIESAAVMGEGLGEYVAACMAGVFDLKDALKLAMARGRWFEEASAAKPVGGSRVDESVLRFEKVVREVKFSLPQVTIVSSVTGEVASDEVRDPAYWNRQLRASSCLATGVQATKQSRAGVVLEIGPPSLTFSESNEELRDGAVLRLASMRKGEDEWTQLLRTLSVIYTSGVAVDWAGFYSGIRDLCVALPNYPFQRSRYWVDAKSAPKKPEPAPDQDILYRIDWRSEEQVDDRFGSVLSGRTAWLVFADQGGVGRALAARLTENGDLCRLVYSAPTPAGERWLDPKTSVAADYSRLLEEAKHDAGPLRGVVHLWSLDASREDSYAGLTEGSELVFRSTLHLAQALVRDREGIPRLWLATRGAQAMTGEEDAHSIAASLSGLARAIHHHVQAFSSRGSAADGIGPTCNLIDLDPKVGADAGAEDLRRELRRSDKENQVAWRTGRRYVRRLVRWSGAPSVEIRADGTYLITGGLGGIGLSVARWLVGEGARHLMLVGRRGAAGAAEAEVRAMRAEGVQVTVTQGDVSLREDVERILAEASNNMPLLRGLFHAAGVIRFVELADESWEGFSQVLAPKVAGSLNLHLATRNLPLDLFVLFSSISSFWPPAQTASYATANAFMDGLAAHRRALGLSGLSINWGFWEEVGMGSASDAEAFRDQMKSLGLGMFRGQEGLAALRRTLGRRSGQVAAMAIDWPVFLSQIEERLGPEPLFEEMRGRFQPASPAARTTKGAEQAARDSRDGDAQGSEILQSMVNVTAAKRRAALVEYIRSVLTRILKVGVIEVAEVEPLRDLGATSLTFVALRSRIARDLEVQVPMRDLLANFSVGGISDAVGAALTERFGAPQEEARESPVVDRRFELAIQVLKKIDPDQIMAKVDEFSEEEVDLVTTIFSSIENK